MIFLIHHHTLIVPDTLFEINLEGFQGQTGSDLFFLHGCPYITRTDMGADFALNKVATHDIAKNNKNQKCYQSAVVLRALLT